MTYSLTAVQTTHPSFVKIAGAISPKSTFPHQGRLGRERIHLLLPIVTSHKYSTTPLYNITKIIGEN